MAASVIKELEQASQGMLRIVEEEVLLMLEMEE